MPFLTSKGMWSAKSPPVHYRQITLKGKESPSGAEEGRGARGRGNLRNGWKNNFMEDLEDDGMQGRKTEK